MMLLALILAVFIGLVIFGLYVADQEDAKQREQKEVDLWVR